MDGNGSGKGGGDGGTGAPSWTTTNAPHYKTLNPPVYSGNGGHCGSSENARLQAEEPGVYRMEIRGILVGSEGQKEPASFASLTFLSFPKKKKIHCELHTLVDERAAAIFVAG